MCVCRLTHAEIVVLIGAFSFKLPRVRLINLNAKGKSIIFGWNTSPQNLHQIAGMLESSLVNPWSSFKYLGIPIALK
jgi:hypothetical protein